MFFLIDAATDEVVQVVPGSFWDFIRNRYGGLYPYKDPHTGMLRTNHILDWAHDYSKYWSMCPPKKYCCRYMCYQEGCSARLSSSLTEKSAVSGYDD